MANLSMNGSSARLKAGAWTFSLTRSGLAHFTRPSCREFVRSGATAAPERTNSLQEGLVKCARPERVNENVHAPAFSLALDPFIDRFAILDRQHFDAIRRQRFHALEQLHVAPGAEQFVRAHRQRKQGSTDTERAADAVDQ